MPNDDTARAEIDFDKLTGSVIDAYTLAANDEEDKREAVKAALQRGLAAWSSRAPAPDERADAAKALALHEGHHRAVMAAVRLGKWMSAALDDQNVCAEMKADIEEWFNAGEPYEHYVLEVEKRIADREGAR